MPAKAPKISQAALADLEEIWLYIATDDPHLYGSGQKKDRSTTEPTRDHRNMI